MYAFYVRAKNQHKKILAEIEIAKREGRPPNLRGRDLRQYDFWGVDLRGANLRGTMFHIGGYAPGNFGGADLTAASVYIDPYAKIGVNFSRATFNGTVFPGQYLRLRQRIRGRAVRTFHFTETKIGKRLLFPGHSIGSLMSCAARLESIETGGEGIYDELSKPIVTHEIELAKTSAIGLPRKVWFPIMVRGEWKSMSVRLESMLGDRLGEVSGEEVADLSWSANTFENLYKMPPLARGRLRHDDNYTLELNLPPGIRRVNTCPMLAFENAV
jgi:hypothetical protein